MTLEVFAWLSISMSRTRLPRRARPAASEIEVLVLPVPPFCDAMEMIIVSV